MQITHKVNTCINNIQVYSVTVMTHVIALEDGQSSLESLLHRYSLGRRPGQTARADGPPKISVFPLE